MGIFLNLIVNHGENFIILLGIVVFVFMIINCAVLSNNKSRIKENLKLDTSIYAINIEEQKIEEAEDQKIVITPNAIRSFENKFNEACSHHDLLIQIIPIFPLLGILGTVAGLMTMVTGDGNMTAETLKNLYSGMSTALNTTFSGLSCSIILKFFDIFFSARIINEVDVMLEDFNKKLELAGIFKKS